MRLSLKTKLSILYLVGYMAGSLLYHTLAQRNAEPFDPMGAEIEANIKHPPVSPKHSAAVAKAMHPVVKALEHAGYQVETVRNGEVVMVTIPCSRLFAPNSSTLLDGASDVLRALNPYVKESENFKTILAVHSDDTGDDAYCDRITSERANAIDEYFYTRNGQAETGIIPYGLGSDEPLKANTSIEGRAANRRVEIYLVPTETFIKHAH